MNVLQHTRNEGNPCLKQNRPDRSHRDTLLIVSICSTIMMTASELIYLNTLYVLCFDLRRDRDTQPREIYVICRLGGPYGEKL